jgi:hypothetical protein
VPAGGRAHGGEGGPAALPTDSTHHHHTHRHTQRQACRYQDQRHHFTRVCNHTEKKIRNVFPKDMLHTEQNRNVL